ncbi:MAG: hypothetical protein HY042_05535 [Spirochaetia bacterium]|nr:hypothetical protein [Spirochaetia bacterium]
MMTRNVLFCTLTTLLFVSAAHGEGDTTKQDPAPNVERRAGHWSFQWGYNRDSYTQSDITFTGPGYKFTLKDVVAYDKPERVSGVYLDPSMFEVPQYNYRFTKNITDHVFFSIGHDHLKYVMRRGQESNIYGYIDPNVAQWHRLHTSAESAPYTILFPTGGYQRYDGFHNGEPIALTPDFLKYEHTDGFNFFYADVGVIHSLWTSPAGDSAVSILGSIGAGPAICRSDVRLFGEGHNNRFHFSGYAVATYVASRVDIAGKVFVELGAKSGYATLTDVITTGRTQERAKQNFGFLETIVSVGTTF